MRGQTVVWSCIAAVCSVLVFAGCNNHGEGDFVFLQSEDAIMPVWTQGDRGGGTFVMHVHGGPGRSSVEFGVEEVFNRIEDDNAVTYWDQRGAGVAQGTVDDDSLTIDQYAEDLDQAVQLVRNRHDVEQLFILSEDIGVGVAARYMQDQENQQAVAGWIFAAGNYDLPMSISLSRDWIIEFANNQIDENNDVGKWEDILEWYDEHPEIDTGDEYREHRDNIDEADGFTIDDGFDRDFWDRELTSPAGGFSRTINYSRSQSTFWDREGSLDLRFTDEMRNIEVPTLVIWGARDGLTPLPMADNAIDTLGTPEEDKRRVILEQAAHRLPLDQNPAFQEAVNEFIDTYQ